MLLRDSGRVARYAETGRSRSLEVFPEPRLKADGSSPLKLSGGRYLLPPWVTEVSAANLSRLGAKWRRDRGDRRGDRAGAAGDGGSVLARAGAAAARAGGGPRDALHDARPGADRAGERDPPGAAARRGQPARARGDRRVAGRVQRVGPPVVRAAVPQAEAEAASAWEFWSGELPEAAKARWMCARFANADGTSSVRGVLAVATPGRTVTLPTGGLTGTWDCSRLKRHLVSATWWQAPSGQWYYLVAGSRDVPRITVTGPTVKDVLAGRGLVAALGPKGGTQPAGEVTVDVGATTVLRRRAPEPGCPVDDCACGHDRHQAPQDKAEGLALARHLRRPSNPISEPVGRDASRWLGILRCTACGRYWAEDSMSSGHADLFFVYPVDTDRPARLAGGGAAGVLGDPGRGAVDRCRRAGSPWPPGGGDDGGEPLAGGGDLARGVGGHHHGVALGDLEGLAAEFDDGAAVDERPDLLAVEVVRRPGDARPDLDPPERAFGAALGGRGEGGHDPAGVSERRAAAARMTVIG